MKKEHKKLIEQIGGFVTGLGAGVLVLRIDRFVRPASHFFLGDLCITAFAGLSSVISYGLGCTLVKEVIFGDKEEKNSRYEPRYTYKPGTYSYTSTKYKYPDYKDKSDPAKSFWSKMSATEDVEDDGDDFEESEFNDDGIYEFTSSNDLNDKTKVKEGE